MKQIYLNEPNEELRRVPIYLVDKTDGHTPVSGVTTPTIRVSKNGAAFDDGAGTWEEMEDGWYYYTPTQDEVDTLGFLSIDVIYAPATRHFPGMADIIQGTFVRGAGSIKVYGTVYSNFDGTPQDDIRIRALDKETKEVLCEDFSNNDGDWYLYLNPGDYLFEFAGEADSIDAFVMQTIEGTVAVSPSEQSFQDVSLETTIIDQGSGSKVVGWDSGTSSWTYGLSPTKVLGEPTGGVRVRAWQKGVELNETNLLAQHRSDEEGKYTLYLNPGDYILKFFKGGYASDSIQVTVT